MRKDEKLEEDEVFFKAIEEEETRIKAKFYLDKVKRQTQRRRLQREQGVC